MEDVQSMAAMGGAGGLMLFVAIKYLWPLMKNGMDVQLANGRAESQLLKQVMEERDRAVARAEASDRRQHELIREVTEMKIKLAEMASKLEHATKELESLRATIKEGGVL